MKFYGFFLAVFLFFSSTNFAQAQQIPFQGKSFYVELSGPSQQLVTDQDAIVLGFGIQQGNVSSDSVVRCGTQILGKNYATNLSYIPLNHVCLDDIYVSKTGNDDAAFVVNYILLSDIPTSGYNLGSVDIATSSAKALADTARTDYVTKVLLLFSAGFFTGVWLFKQ